MIKLTCRKNDSRKFTAPKFDTFVTRERINGQIPAREIHNDVSNDEFVCGIYNQRHLVKIDCSSAKKLPGLAGFLARQLDGSAWVTIHGQNPCNPNQYKYTISLTSRYTQADIWVLLGLKTREQAEDAVKVWSLSGPAKLNGFLLPIIEIGETAEQYFIRCADEILNLDGLKNCIASVEINGEVYDDK